MVFFFVFSNFSYIFSDNNYKTFLHFSWTIDLVCLNSEDQWLGSKICNALSWVHTVCTGQYLVISIARRDHINGNESGQGNVCRKDSSTKRQIPLCNSVLSVFWKPDMFYLDPGIILTFHFTHNFPKKLIAFTNFSLFPI